MDDVYTITEVSTDDGYGLPKEDIQVVIAQTEITELCDTYKSDVLGLIQNDSRYAEIINDTGDLKNIPQKHLEHHLLTAAATVDGNNVNTLEDNGSINAHAPLTVVNTRGFDAPGKGRMPVTVLLRICAMWKINEHHAQTLEIVCKKTRQNAHVSVANSTGYDTIKVTCPIWAIMKGELQCVLVVPKRSRHKRAVWA